MSSPALGEVKRTRIKKCEGPTGNSDSAALTKKLREPSSKQNVQPREFNKTFLLPPLEQKTAKDPPKPRQRDFNTKLCKPNVAPQSYEDHAKAQQKIPTARLRQKNYASPQAEQNIFRVAAQTKTCYGSLTGNQTV
jgi:hypothetical protein